MATVSSAGHNANLTTFFKLVKVAKEIGESYNPSLKHLSVTSLEGYYTTGQKVLSTQQKAEVAYFEATNARSILFDTLEDYTSRVVSIYLSSGLENKSTEAVRAIHGSMNGKRLTASSTIESGKQAASLYDGSQTKTKQHLTTQLSYDDRAACFAQLASYVEANPLYSSCENDITKENVKKYSEKLNAANARCLATEKELETTRIHRDKIFYTNSDSLYHIFRDVKIYIKGAFGSLSSEYKRVSGLEFKLLAR